MTQASELSLNLDFLRERFVQEHAPLKFAFDNYVTELGKFFSIARLCAKPLAILGPRIDELWHTFILFTPQYREFCADNFGFYVDHQPNTAATPVPTIAVYNFLSEYKNRYGGLPDIWFEGLPSHVCKSLRDERRLPLNHQWSGWIPRQDA